MESSLFGDAAEEPSDQCHIEHGPHGTGSQHSAAGAADEPIVDIAHCGAAGDEDERPEQVRIWSHKRDPPSFFVSIP